MPDDPLPVPYVPRYNPVEMLSTEARKMVWRSLLEADYRSRYFGELAGNFDRRETLMKWAAAILSSAVAVTLITALEEATGFTFMAEFFALAAATLVWALTFMKYGDKSKLSASLHRQWSEIAIRQQELWGRLDRLESEEAIRRWKRIETAHLQADEQAAAQFRLDRKLARRVQNEMIASLGINRQQPA